MLQTLLRSLGAAFAAAVFAFAAQAQDTIKIAYMDPLSGPFAQVGDQNLTQMRYVLDYVNNVEGGALGKKFELVTFDDKLQPAEALIALRAITDQHIPIVMQCSGSNIAAALIDAINKHNERNPDNRIVYVNCGAVATELTNENCSFWHFRFDANAQMKADVLVRALPKDVTKVYLLNQDYLFGQSLDHDVNAFLSEVRPDVQVVGDELIPLGKVKDFSPYITKIKASGAQALITGNWGPDITLLIKAGMDAGLDVKYYTLYAGSPGAPAAIGAAGDGKVFLTAGFTENLAAATGDQDLKKWIADFRDHHQYDFVAAGYRTIFEFIQGAFNKAGSTDPAKFARALEGMTRADMLGNQLTMRAEDHQLMLPYFVAVFSKNVPFDAEKTGLGWKAVSKIDAKDLALPTSCRMKRPSA